MSNKFKYHNEIDKVQQMGICCPPDELTVPNNLQTFRFVFEDPNHTKNHKPPGANKPHRVLTEKDQKKCSLYGLSCFKRPDSAKQFFSELRKINPLFYKAVGETLSSGVLDGNDGLMTEEGRHTHFDLFEFENCNLSNKFTPIEKLI
jgi:hypothetical protein